MNDDVVWQNSSEFTLTVPATNQNGWTEIAPNQSTVTSVPPSLWQPWQVVPSTNTPGTVTSGIASGTGTVSNGDIRVKTDGVTSEQFGRLLVLLSIPDAARGFLLAALEHPADDTLFDVLADYLEEQDSKSSDRFRQRAAELRKAKESTK